MAQAASKSCEICIGAPGLHYCTQCDQLFCDGCKTLHQRTKSTQNHTFLCGLNINPEEKLLCQEHSNDFMFNCVQCDGPVCQTCVVSTHSGHKMVSISDSVGTIKDDITKQLLEKISALQSIIAQTETGTNNYKANVAEAITSIKQAGESIKTLVDSRVEFLVKSLEDKETKNLCTLSTAHKNLKETLNIVLEKEQIVENIQKTGGEAAILQKLKTIKTEVDKIETYQVSQFPTTNYTQKTVTNNEIENLFGHLSHR